MPVGLEVYDENSTLVIAVTDRITKVLGSFTTTLATTGTYAFQDPGIGIIWFSAVGISSRFSFSVTPYITYSNNQFKWDFTNNGMVVPPPNEQRLTARVIFGVR